MGATDVVKGYFDAWNRHDPEAIAATFVQGGTYTDPNAPEGLSGRAIAEYSSDLFAAFPDLLFDLVSHSSTDDEVVAARVGDAWDQYRPLEGKPSERRHRRPAWSRLHRSGGRQNPLCGNLPMIPLSVVLWARQARALLKPRKSPGVPEEPRGHVFSVRGRPESL